MKYSVLVFMLFIFNACDQTTEKTDSEKNENDEQITLTPFNNPNILLIIADDISKDSLSWYSEGSTKANTPNLEQLKLNGISFENLWVYPTCTPTRSSIITGKYGIRTGVEWVGDILSDNETILQKYINEQNDNAYSTAIIGKWHLAGGDQPRYNPEDRGIDYFAGIISGATDYYDWSLAQDGTLTAQTDYITEKFTNLAIDWVNEQTNPWFLWMAYTAPHTPFHLPPSEMHSQEHLQEYNEEVDQLPYYIAAIEALDFQIGRLIQNIPQEELDNTVIIFIGDNGAPKTVSQFPYGGMKAKATIYQGGINTPMIVSGVNVTRTGQDYNLINSVDFFPTIAELTGIEIQDINYFDGQSFIDLFQEEKTIRDYQYMKMDDGETNVSAVSDGEFKLIQYIDKTQEFYDLSSDPYENFNLMEGELNVEQANSLTEFVGVLEEIEGGFVPE